MHKPKVLVIAAEDIIIRNIFDTGLFQELSRELAQVDVTTVVPEGRREEMAKRFPDMKMVSFARATPSKADALIATLMYAGLPTHTNHWSKMRALHRGAARTIPTYLKRLHATTLGRLKPYLRFLRALYILVGVDKNAGKLFDEVNPDLVISLSVTNFDTDVVLMREARRRRIRIVGMTRSWDNLSSHGLLRVVPNHLIVQNTFLRDVARGVQGIRPRDADIDVVGLPHYDLYMDASLYESREDFCMRNKLDPKKKILLYCGMGSFLFKREGDVIDILEQDIETGAMEKDTQVLYSVHPKFRTSLERTVGKRHVVASHELSYVTSGDTRSPTRDLINLIRHADVAIMGASTMAIDAAMFDRPIVCVGFDGFAKPGEIPYWESVKRFYDSYTHFEELLATGGAMVAYSRKELDELVNRYLADPELEREGRMRIVKRFVGEPDGHAGERLARILKDEITSI